MRVLSMTFLFSLLLFMVSCKSNPKGNPEAEKLYIKTVSVTGMDDKKTTSETISEITSDYFEIGIGTLTTGGYSAGKDVIEPEVGKEFKYVFFFIINKDGSNINFATSTDFLNYMSARGYDMVSQIPNQYGAEYTFKRKNNLKP